MCCDSGGSSVQAPDPRLVEAQIRSMGIQDEAAKSILAMAQQQQQEQSSLIPLQKQSLQFGLDTAKTGWDQSQSDRQWLLDRRGALTGMQDKMVSDATSFDSVAEQNKAAGKAFADVGSQVSASNKSMIDDLTSRGVNLADGRIGDILRTSGVDAARVGVTAANDARLSARNEGRMLVDRANNALAGYPAQATGVTSQGAGIGSSAVSTTNSGVGGVGATYGQMTGTYGAAGSAAGGLGANATGMYAAQANFKNAQDELANSGAGDIYKLVGAAAGTYSAFKGSARRYKTGIRRVGTHPALGIGIYRFSYLPQFARRWGAGEQVGVMADELKAVLPAAVGRDADGFTVVDYSMI